MSERRRAADRAPRSLLALLLLLIPACSPSNGDDLPARPASTPQRAPLTDGVAAETPAAHALVPGVQSTADLRRSPALYELAMEAERYAAVEVAQDGVDVEVHLLAPDGTRVTRVDSHTGTYGVEHLMWISERDGVHRVEIRPLQAAGAGDGSYSIRLTVAPRPPTAEDRQRVRAARRYAAGHARLAAGDDDAAVAAFATAAAGFAAIGEPLLRAAALYSEGVVQLTGRHDPAAALEPLRRCAELYRRGGRPMEAGIATNSLASALRDLHRFDEAIARYRSALPLFEECEDWGRLALVHNNLALLLSLRGDGGEALGDYETAVKLWRKADDRTQLGIALTNLGDLHERLGDRPVAMQRYRQAVEIFRRLDEPRDLAWALGKRCSLVADAGRLEEAESCIREALAIQRAVGDGRGEALSLVVLGSIAGERGDAVAARSDQSRALAWFVGHGEELPAAILRMNLGWLDLDAAQPLHALVRFHRALRVFRDLGTRHQIVSARFGVARALAERGDTRQALRWCERALELVEELRLSPQALPLRARYLASRHAIYDFHVELLMRLHAAQPDGGWSARAFAACERARARTLLEKLTRLDVDGSAAGDEERRLVARRRALERRLDDLEKRRSDLIWERRAGTSGELEAVTAELAETTVAWQRVWARSGRAGAAPVAFGADLVQREVVDAGSTLLSFHLGRDRSFLWVVDPERLEVFELPPREALERAARHVHDTVRRSRRHTYRVSSRAALHELSEMLLTPAAPRLGDGRRLLIAAEDALLYVPFAALPLPGDERPLVADHEVVILPSASALAVQRRRLAGRPRAAGSLAVIADPVFQYDDRFDAAPPGSNAALERSGETLERLPYSAREAAAILALAPPPTLRATGFEATRELVLSGRLSGYRMIHLATHARVDAGDSAGSGLIMLSRLDAAGRPRVGELRSREIYRLHLDAELVTLSACRTALGEEIRGEGLVGLTHGFLTAGAARVLVSLWDVGDESTAVLMERFYRGLFRDGLSPAASLRQAQLSMRREERWRAPYHWAGFILQGEPR